MPKRQVQITFSATLTKVVVLPKHEADDFSSDMLDKEFDALESAGWSLDSIEEVVRDETDVEPRDD